jgi:Xaa-Pro aminopeptidase
MTLSMPRPPHRLERLRRWMADEEVDCTVLFGADHVNHLCGYWRYFGGASALVIGRDGERTLVAARDEVPIAAAAAQADSVAGYGERGFGINLDPVADLVAAVAKLPAVAGARRLGVACELPGADARLSGAISGAVVEAGPALHRISLVKDWDELERILTGYELCWLGQQAVARAAVPGVSEIELFTAAQAAAQIASGGPIEYICDLLSGPATADVCCPVHVAGPRAVEDGDAVIADVVVRTAGYWGDTAETYVVGRNDEAAERRALLLDILDQAAAELVPGARGAAIFANMQARVQAAFPGGELPHHGGHGLGRSGFEDPHLIPSDTTPLEEWMVVAVEPGVYVPGSGGARVERVFVVTEEGGVELREALGGAAASV